MCDNGSREHGLSRVNLTLCTRAYKAFTIEAWARPLELMTRSFMKK